MSYFVTPKSVDCGFTMDHFEIPISPRPRSTVLALALASNSCRTIESPQGCGMQQAACRHVPWHEHSPKKKHLEGGGGSSGSSAGAVVVSCTGGGGVRAGSSVAVVMAVAAPWCEWGGGASGCGGGVDGKGSCGGSGSSSGSYIGGGSGSGIGGGLVALIRAQARVLVIVESSLKALHRLLQA